MVHPRVLRAMASPVIGHLDPAFLALMTVIQQQLRRLFQTTNAFTVAVSGTGSAGMETAVVNLVEPGDAVIVGVNGLFGSRIATMVERCGGKPIRIEAEWGTIIDPDQVRSALQRSGPVKAVAIVHAETSTGACQPLAEIARLCREHDALFVVDAVTSLGGVPVEVDAWQIDVCYSGTQKCLSCPPGLAPLTMSERALSAIRRRHTPCQSWYLDVTLVADYWHEGKRAYHHTAPISMLYALHEALCLIEEEGLPPRFARHRLNSQALLAGLKEIGLSPLPADAHCLPTLHCISLPPSWDEKRLRCRLLDDHEIEIGGGLGPLQGKVWRIGLMGESSTKANVLVFLDAIEAVTAGLSSKNESCRAVQVAQKVYVSQSLEPGSL
jgi:alanine-glyoxylate transaminase/serine-glyoxylate transaminase/serine-pyruvate transaminase